MTHLTRTQADDPPTRTGTSNTPGPDALAGSSPTVRSLSVPGGHNIRDLGGIPLADGSGVIECGRVLRGEAPALLGPDGVQALLDYGVGHVVDLRSPGEVEAEGHGHLEVAARDGRVHVHAVPLLNDRQWADDPVGQDASVEVGAHYLSYLDNGGHRLVEALRTGVRSGRAVYLHCAVGKDRTGIAAAVLLDALGARRDAIVEDYVHTAQVFRPIIAALGTRPTYARDLAAPVWALVTPVREAMHAALERLDKRGGGAGWLAEHGVSGEELESWRSSLVYRPERSPSPGESGAATST